MEGKVLHKLEIIMLSQIIVVKVRLLLLSENKTVILFHLLYIIQRKDS